MSDQRSYAALEREILPAYRKEVAAAASAHEVQQQFARAVCALVEKASAGAVRCRHADVTLLPSQAPHYTLSEDMTAQAAFQAVWNDSDIAVIFARLAEPAVHRCVHIGKHAGKTNTNHYIKH